MLQPERVDQEWLLSAGKQAYKRINEVLDINFCINNYTTKAGDNGRRIYSDYNI